MLGVGLQSVAKWITKCVRDYKVWQGGLQSASGITKCGNSGLQSMLGVGLQSVAKWITKCVRDYQV